MDINIKAKLKAYSKGVIPVNISQLYNDLDFIPDAPNDSKIYARKDKAWINVDEELRRTTLSLDDNSGLNLDFNPDTLNYTLSVRKKDILKNQLPNTLEHDTVYYVMELTPNNYINGGTAFSNGDNDFVDISDFNSFMNGGAANTQANVFVYPTNSEGVYNG